MLHNVAKDDGYAELRRIADGREEQRHSVRMSKTCSVAVDCRPMMRTGTLTSLLLWDTASCGSHGHVRAPGL